MAIHKNGINPLKMASTFSHIPPKQASLLPWKEIQKLFSAQSIRELERSLGFSISTISRAWSDLRGLSAKNHQTLVEKMAGHFSTEEQMRIWMRKHWPAELLDQYRDFLKTFWKQAELNDHISMLGVFPADYVERNEKQQILDLLLNDRQAQIIWITGPGGSGKSTLMLSILQRNWLQLHGYYERFFWVNIEEGSYKEGLRQIAEQLDFDEKSPDAIEQKIRVTASKSRTLFLLDAMHEVKDLEKWRMMAGGLGKLVITSRVSLSEIERQSDMRMRQVEIGNFSMSQSAEFFGFGNQTDTPSNDAFGKIIGFTEGHPLALRLLKSYKDTTALSLPELWIRLEKYKFSLLSRSMNTSKNSNMKICFDFSFDLLKTQYPIAAKLFEYIGIFQENTTPFSFLYDISGETNQFVAEENLLILKQFHMVSVSMYLGEQIVNTHRLLFEYAKDRLSAKDNYGNIHHQYLLWTGLILDEFKNEISKSVFYPFRKWIIKDIVYLLNYVIQSDDVLKIEDARLKSHDLLLEQGELDLADRMIKIVLAKSQKDTFSAWRNALLKKHEAGINAAQGEKRKAYRNFKQAQQWVNEDYRQDPLFWDIFSNSRDKYSPEKFRSKVKFYRSYFDQKYFGKFRFVVFLYGNRWKQKIIRREMVKARDLFSDEAVNLAVRANMGIEVVDSLLAMEKLVEAEKALDMLEEFLAPYKSKSSFTMFFGRFWLRKAVASDMRGSSETAFGFIKYAIKYYSDGFHATVMANEILTDEESKVMEEGKLLMDHILRNGN